MAGSGERAHPAIVRRVVPCGHKSIIALSTFSRPLLPTEPRDSRGRALG